LTKGETYDILIWYVINNDVYSDSCCVFGGNIMKLSPLTPTPWMSKLEKLAHTVNSEAEFFEAVNRSYWWYLDEPRMKTWSRYTLSNLYKKCRPEIEVGKIEILRGF